MIERYEHSKHKVKIASWLAARGIHCPEESDFAEVGLVVDDVVAGWVYQTDGPIARLDDFVSNPFCEQKDKSDAWQILIINLEMEARRLGFKYMDACVNHPSLIKAFSGYPKVGNYERFTKAL